MRRILLLIKGLGRGGAERILVGQARHFDRARFEYEVAYLRPDKSALVGELEEHGLAVHCLNGTRGLGWVRRLRRLVAQGGIDLLHVHSPYPAIGARVVVPRRRVPLVYTEHNVWESYRRLTYAANFLTFPRNDHVFAVSNRVRLSLRYPRPFGFLGVPPVETLYYGLDPTRPPETAPARVLREDLGLPDGVPVVGTIASFKRHKGHTHLLLAAALVRDAVPEVRFVLIGAGPLEGEIRHQASRLGLDETVVLAGYRDDAVRLAAAFDVFALASVYEGLSIALVEAMALGKPAVVTAVGGLPEVVEHGKQGLVVSARDPTALADGIITLLDDPALRRRLGEGGRRRAADFDIRKAVRRTEQVYDELLA
jgi:glycosyltransferase involved in cell wall biosynthesis